LLQGAENIKAALLAVMAIALVAPPA